MRDLDPEEQAERLDAKRRADRAGQRLQLIIVAIIVILGLLSITGHLPSGQQDCPFLTTVTTCREGST